MEFEEQFLPAYTLAVQKDILVNLLPEQIKAREKEAQYSKYARIGGVALMGIFVVWSIITLAERNRISSSVQLERYSVQQKREQLDRLAPIRSSLVYNELGPIVAEIERRDSSFIILMKYLSSRIPKDVYVKQIDFTRSDAALPAPAPPASAQPGQPPVPAAPAKAPEAPNNVQLKGLIFGDAGDDGGNTAASHDRHGKIKCGE